MRAFRSIACPVVKGELGAHKETLVQGTRGPATSRPQGRISRTPWARRSEGEPPTRMWAPRKAARSQPSAPPLATEYPSSAARAPTARENASTDDPTARLPTTPTNGADGMGP